MSSVVVIERDHWLRSLAAALHIGKWDRDDAGRLRRGSWMQTLSGRKVYPLDPRADEIDYDDVCLGLAREWRFGNHTVDDYSVATHSVLVSTYAERIALERGWSVGEAHEVACEGLMHDGAEAYLGDIPKPLKEQRIMRGYKKIEARWWVALCERFGIRPTRESTAIVKEADTRILIDEINTFMLDPDMWWTAGRYQDVVGFNAEISTMTWQQSADVFTQRFVELGLDTEMFE